MQTNINDLFTNPFISFFLVFVLSYISLALILSIKKHLSPDKNYWLQAVLGNLNVAVICVNPGFRIKFINTECEKLFKYSSQQLIGKKLDRLFENNSDYNVIIQEINNLPRAAQSITQPKELSVIDANNNKIPVTISCRKIGRDSKSPTGFIIVLNDIQETKKYYQSLEQTTREILEKKEFLKKLQKELEIEQASIDEKAQKRQNDFEKEHARFRSSINDLSLCFIMTDKYNNIIFNNKAANNIFPFLNTENKITVAELQESAKMFLDLNTHVEKAIKEKRCVNIPAVQIGSKFININISPLILKLPQHDNKKYLDTRQSEPESGINGLKSNQNLDVLGTVMIIEDQTTQHDLERSKEDLFNIASHELRTPLTAIYGYTALIKQIYFSNIQNEELKMIINNIGILSKKLSLSVSNFLDSSKLEQGKIELKEEQCNLFTLINDSIKEMEVMTLWKNIYIKFDPPQLPVIINADRTRVIQIMNILISNAIKYTLIGGIYISVETKANSVKVIIKDTGTGISEENKKLLFRKFQRTGDNLLTRQEGTGLGLHIAKLLIEKMRGTIMLEKTEINKGSTFSFTIPTINN